MDNYYNIHEALKRRNYKYPVRMYWIPSKLKYKNTKFIYGWHLIKEQWVGIVIIKLGRFFTEEYLNRQE